QIQLRKTAIRLRKPIKKKMWTMPHSTHANPTGKPDSPEIGDRRMAADRREHAFVAIAEWRRRRFSAHLPGDHLCDIVALLFGDGRYTRQRNAAGVRDEGGVTNYKDLGVSGDRQVGGDLDPPAFGSRQAEPARDRGGFDPGAPDDVRRLDPLAAGEDARPVDGLDGRIEKDFHAHPPE